MKLIELNEEDMMAVNGGWDPPSDTGPIFRALMFDDPEHPEDPIAPPDYRYEHAGSSMA